MLKLLSGYGSEYVEMNFILEDDLEANSSSKWIATSMGMSEI